MASGLWGDMHLTKLGVRNFRRLSDVIIDLDSDISIFVGANNSGKTSAGHALQLFTGRGSFSVHDFSAELWQQIVEFGEGEDDTSLPTIEIDLWFEVGPSDLHRVIDLLPNLAWQGSLIGMRIAFEPIDAEATRAAYVEARQRALAASVPSSGERGTYNPSPQSLHHYLRTRLNTEYELRHYVLDPSRFDATMAPEDGYTPALLAGRDRSGREILNSLIKIDFLHAQRHLSDSPGGARAEDLSRVLSRFYDRNLEQMGDDLATLRALADSEVSLNEHLERVFEPTLKSLSTLGYPGLANPRLMIRSTLDPGQIMSSRDGTRVHYALGPDDGEPNPRTLPDRYNGLGFKNLIFMVVELLDLHAQWLAIQDKRPPVHLIFIEEPEAHLHAQLQQAFIRKVLAILEIEGPDWDFYTSQIVATTHSTHILYERGFRPIRYFRRSRAEHESTSEVLNLSVFYDSQGEPTRTFLERYLKLTHCDLFFADAAVLVEGNVERLLLPQMIAGAAPRLQSSYLTILEIGGAFGHRFKDLIEFLGLTTLIITDLDSVVGPSENDSEPAQADATAESEREADDEREDGTTSTSDSNKPGTACVANYPGATTSNQTLIQWLPKLRTVAELWGASDDRKIQIRTRETDAVIRVAYQCPVRVSWGNTTNSLAGRTLEEAFALENLAWSQDEAQASLHLRIAKASEHELDALAKRIHKRVQASSFNKTDFALAVLEKEPTQWSVPAYIAEGLRWLETQIVPQEARQDKVAGGEDTEISSANVGVESP